MAANPTVLFLDEPTSGLDSVAADTVMDAVKAITATGRTVVCTIHQPSRYLFGMFDHLLLLKRGGQTVFFGETGLGAGDLIAYLTAIPAVPPYNSVQNPATWMLNALDAEGVDFARQYADSDLHLRNKTELESLLQNVEIVEAPKHLFESSLWTQFRLLLLRWGRLQWRTPGYNISRTMTTVAIALITGTVFYQIDARDPQSFFSKVGVQYNAFVFTGIIFLNALQPVFARERLVFYREKAACMYRPGVLSLAAGLSEVPYVVCNSLVFASIFYWMVGLKPAVSAYWFWVLVYLLHISFCTAFGLFLASVCPTVEIAWTLTSTFIPLWALLCGYMLPRLSIPWWWRWLHYTIPPTYVFQDLISSQFYCDTADLAQLCPTITSFAAGSPQPQLLWPYARDRFNLNYGARWAYVGILAGSVVLSWVASALALRFVDHSKR